MTCAKRVATTDGMGLNTVIGDAGIFVLPRDPRSLADALLRLLSDSPLRTKLGQDARSIVVKRHSWESLAAGATRLFQQLVDLRRASPKTV